MLGWLPDFLNLSLPQIYVGLSYFFITYFLFANFVFLMLLTISFFSIRYVVWSRPMIYTIRERLAQLAPRLAVIAPAYNEASVIVQSVHSFLLLNYPNHEVVIVNDGSTDNTLEILIENFQLEKADLFYDSRLSDSEVKGFYKSYTYPNLIVIDKENGGGKADANNVGIGASRAELVCCVDCDSILEPGALLTVIQPFIEEPETTVASGGTIRPINGSDVKAGRIQNTRLPRTPIVLIQVVEYLRAFLFGRVGWNFINSTMLISGAFGIFKKSALIEVGGYEETAIGEDLELILRLRRHFMKVNKQIRVSFVPDPVCWTEVPSTWTSLGNQRMRWQRGLIQALVKHREIFFNPRFGVVGLLAFPYFVIVELLGPLIEILAYIVIISGSLLGYVDFNLLMLFIVVDIVYGQLMSFGAVLIEESAYHKYPRIKDVIILSFVALFEHLGYRQINSIWRLIATIKYCFGFRSTWGKMDRVGFSNADP